MLTTFLGFAGVVGLIALAIWMRSTWFGIVAAFILMNCWRGLQQARALSRLTKLPRHMGLACPCCKTAPPLGNYWKCSTCSLPFDTFQSQAVCPHCGTRVGVTACLDCGRASPMSAWIISDLVAT